MKTKNLSVLLTLLASPLVLFASSATDNKIEETVKASYNYRTVLEDHVKVKANDGIVTLTGTVQDNDERALAVDTVENIPGVTAVKNEIKIKSDYPEKSDGWMALKIRGRLLVKGNVSASTTTVNVQDGVATLTGTAENIAQKELTGIYAAEIDGVKSVRNEIVIDDKAAIARRTAAADRRADNRAVDNRRTDDGRDLGDRIDDASITSQVKYALLTHKSTSALKTKVVTADGVVVVTGDAASEAEKSLVTKLARDVRGVNKVNNNMVVIVKS
jgi:osmotically-inducible protein OsmY